jgi:hypothetical protein
MLTKFWEKLGENLGSELSARLLTPAFAFWGGAFLTWIYRFGWMPFNYFLENVKLSVGVAVAVGVLFVLVVSPILMQWLTQPVLRIFEGYRFFFLGSLLMEIINARVAKKEQDWSNLADQYENGSLRLDSAKNERYIRLDAELEDYPADLNLRMPTHLGNILRAAEEYPQVRYGLEISTTWARLWLVLPQDTRKELSEARQALNQSVQLLTWGLMFAVWVLFAWWAVLVALGVASVAVLRMWATAGVYGQLLRSAYDLHRFALYESLRWPLPLSPELEKETGEKLTFYLKRNLPPTAPFNFKHPEEDKH